MDGKAGKYRLDIDRKIYALIFFGIICAISLIVLVNVSINTTSGIRAIITAESYWAKAQKEAVLHLNNYIFSQEEEHYEYYKELLLINLGDQQARKELIREDFDPQKTYNGLLQGKNHPDDIPHMISLFRRFRWTTSVQQALDLWERGDEKVSELNQIADSIHTTLQAGPVSENQKQLWAHQLLQLDADISQIKESFSIAMGDMARSVNRFLRWSTIIFGLTLISIGGWLTRRFIKSTSAWAESLRKSEERFKDMLNNSRDVLYKMNLKTRKYEYVSPALKTMLGYEPEKLEKEGVEFIFNNMHPDDREEMEKVVERYEQPDSENFMPAVEFRLKDRSGNWVWVSNARLLVYGPDGNPEAIVGSVRDISTRKKQEEQITKSLEEKEILLKEIHHRIKNNLSIISSMLELQKEGMSKEVQDMLEASQSRIKSIAKVHEKLYKSTTLSEISMDVYISELTEEITQTYASDQRNIEVTIDVAPFSMKTRQAIPFGLVLNELINNAYKHGFKDVEKGKINISFKQQGEKMELRVENTGNVAPAELNLEESDSLGMTLIHVLAERFNGDVSVVTDDWTRFIITFDADQISQSSN
ncbi:sensor histidine kinase [Gracilimonas mengyeensis]|uniref:histidine kinase n=1 Tax=Gracilimonas mengyeensis TaxID=1302730 RepID=A0A521DZP6_9BACT|nr:histidine kinase dimerization/phosphoacceptor domain -containing protein [Gracilimonas mengyeensis]SMO77187.1 PAS domain S-box-containing protein [Gracilimonas mengyeensis]